MARCRHSDSPGVCDGVKYITRDGPREDLILVDAYDRHGVAPQLATSQFYRDAKRRLTLGGVLVINIFGALDERANHFAKIQEVFGKRVTALPVRGENRKPKRLSHEYSYF